MLKKEKERIILHTSNIKEGERKNYIIHFIRISNVRERKKELYHTLRTYIEY